MSAWSRPRRWLKASTWAWLAFSPSTVLATLDDATPCTKNVTVGTITSRTRDPIRRGAIPLSMGWLFSALPRCRETDAARHRSRWVPAGQPTAGFHWVGSGHGYVPNLSPVTLLVANSRASVLATGTR